MSDSSNNSKPGIYELGVAPTHNFEMLKQVRQREYEKAVDSLKVTRTSYDLATTDKDILSFRQDWLQDELSRNAEGWIRRNQQNQCKRPSHLIELKKYRDFLRLEIDQLTTVRTISRTPATDQPPVATYKTFADLFINPDDIDSCVDALRRYRPEKPVLGEGLTWIGGPKRVGIIVAWIDNMEQAKQPKIHFLNDRRELVKLLNGYFINLNMGIYARVFENPVDRDVKDRFITLMAC